MRESETDWQVIPSDGQSEEDVAGLPAGKVHRRGGRRGDHRRGGCRGDRGLGGLASISRCSSAPPALRDWS